MVEMQSQCKVRKSSAKIRCRKSFTAPANSEIVTHGKLPATIGYGVQGICTPTKTILGKDLLVAKTVVCCPLNHKVPVKLINVTDSAISVDKGQILALFTAFDSTIEIKSTEEESPSCAHATLCSPPEQTNTDINEQIQPKGSSLSELDNFISNFELPKDLADGQTKQLAECLYDCQDIFVTPRNSSLGLTHLVEHKIHLKPDYVPKHQRPYRLPPDKREVLRHQLDELVQQGIIRFVDETQDLPFTSPIVLVTKRNKSKKGLVPGTKEASLALQILL
ncbi:uncharacterized protein LOC124260765 [Haliotis rubra]|uniref:uncharacterized protein LOC124260765 n=1 Tax=Haliotis rubra TaxID=36100 RepID=UPI001EE589F8|nr:uncharacterized protein LOC124260765 [Haliotis rubra]